MVLQRWHFGTNGAIQNMGWSHNYPESEVHLNEFIDRTTRIDVEPDSYRLLELSSEEIFKYPFAYISEPGEMEMTEAEVANMREYIDRGGFILIDDFDTWHMDNLREEMRRVFPDRQFVRLTISNPIFDLVFKVEDLDSMAPHVRGTIPCTTDSATTRTRSRSSRCTTTTSRTSGSGTDSRNTRSSRPPMRFGSGRTSSFMR